MSLARTLPRFTALLLTLLAVFVSSRALIRWLPGDPLETLIAETGTPLPPEELKKELGLDRPFLAATAADLGKLVRHGDLGRSILSGEEVAPMVRARFLKTSVLAGLTLLIGLPLSLLLGLAAAGAANPTLRRVASTACDRWGSLAAALPTPWVGPVLMYLFCVRLPLFEVAGSPYLAALTLSLGFVGLWSRMIRARVTWVMEHGSARGARARGVGEIKVILKYGLAPASGALAAYLGTQVGSLLSGSFIAETLFSWPGLGSLFVDSVLSRDYPMVEGAVFVGGAASLVGTLAGDWARAALDPRAEER